MKKIVVIGNSIAAAKAIEDIKEADKTNNITVFTIDNNPPYYRELLPDYIANEVDAGKVFYKPSDYYEKNNIRLITDRKITRVNFKRSRVFTDEKETFDYDVLLIANSQDSKFPDVPGTRKTGVYNLKRIDNAKEILERLNLNDTVAIQAVGIDGIKLAYAVNKHGKEAVLIFPSGATPFDEEFINVLKVLIEEANVRIVSGQSVEAILGDSDVKAVRLDSGKVFGCEMVVFENVRPDLKMYKDTPLNFTDRIAVDTHFKTNIENVFAVDEMCESAKANGSAVSEDSLEQGKVVAGAINGQDVTYSPAVSSGKTKLFGADIAWIGRISAGEGDETLLKSDQEHKTYIKLIIRENRIVGALMVNSDQEYARFFDLIKQNQDISEIRGNLLGAGDEPIQEIVPSSPQLVENIKVTGGSVESEEKTQEQSHPAS